MVSRASPVLAHIVRLFAVLALVVFSALPATAREEILSFDVVLEVEPDGAFLVTERIQVRAEGFEIRRGIFRDFPTVRRFESGLVEQTTFDVLSVTRDGMDEPHHEEGIEGGRRLYIGDANIWLDTGVYTYEITYRSRHQMGFFADYDEVYWNATGNFWSFPILSATATIRLPEGAQLGETAAFTGRFGAAESRAQISALDSNTVRFSTTGRLAPREGLTVAVAFQKGLVAEPSANAQTLRRLIDNIGLVILMFGAIAVAGFMALRWSAIGRDPQRGVIIPRFEPPRGLSPAAVSYIHFRGHGSHTAGKTFMAALVSLGTKSRLQIQESGSVVSLHKMRGVSADGLPSGESALMTRFFKTSDDVAFTRGNASTLISANSKFRKAIIEEFSDRYFKKNIGTSVLGAILAIVTIFFFLLIFPGTETFIVAVIFHALGGLATGFLLTMAWGGWTQRDPGTSRFVAFCATIGAIGIAATLLVVFHGPMSDQFTTSPLMLVALLLAALMGASVGIFGKLMFAPTPAGREVMDEIEGFRLYLSVAEADRMNMAGKPDFSLDLFERFLPYAIGLGVEKPWSKALESHFERIDPSQRQAYSPRYYSGSTFNSGNIAASTAAIASTIGAAYAASMPKSSGSSGGGSSGGGGGGGGGGGW